MNMVHDFFNFKILEVKQPQKQIPKIMKYKIFGDFFHKLEKLFKFTIKKQKQIANILSNFFSHHKCIKSCL